MIQFSPRQVTIQDAYWSRRLEVNASRALAHQWEQLEASGCIENFRIAAGRSDRLREGWFFADSDAYKWLEAAGRVHLTQPDPALDRQMDEFIELLGAAQAPNGYLFTYNQIHFPGVRWVNLQIEHELYCHGHLIEAGVSHYEATGKTSLLEIARRAADMLVREFLDAGPEQTPGHEEVEIALLRLADVTGEKAYRELAAAFLNRRGRTRAFGLKLWRQQRSTDRRGRQVKAARDAYLAAHPLYKPHVVPPGNPAVQPRWSKQRWMLNALAGKYFQQHAPLERQRVPVGHAVRFGYLQTARAMMAGSSTHDHDPVQGLESSWDHMVERRMYVTGGLGSLPALEGFGRDYELDPEVAYAETCAALASIFWNWEMALVTAKARYSDLLEWQLYNAAGVGMSLTGDRYLYNNPLVSRGNVTRLPWYAVPCCPSNLSRTWASLAKYIYSVQSHTAKEGKDDAASELFIHQYIGNRAQIEVNGPVELEMKSGLPWHGAVEIHLSHAASRAWRMHVRVPSWCDGNMQVRVNGRDVPVVADHRPSPGKGPVPALASAAGGYDPRPARWLTIDRIWTSGDTVQLGFDMPVKARHARKVKGHDGKVAVTRGPLVYCLESPDNPSDFFDTPVDPAALNPVPLPGVLGGIVVLRGCSVTAIPYALWGNRGPSQMTVWMTEQVKERRI